MTPRPAAVSPLVQRPFPQWLRIGAFNSSNLPIACAICRAPDTAHARRKFDELLLDSGKSSGVPEALRRIAEIYRLKRLARRGALKPSHCGKVCMRGCRLAKRRA